MVDRIMLYSRLRMGGAIKPRWPPVMICHDGTQLRTRAEVLRAIYISEMDIKATPEILNWIAEHNNYVVSPRYVRAPTGLGYVLDSETDLIAALRRIADDMAASVDKTVMMAMAGTVQLIDIRSESVRNACKSFAIPAVKDMICLT